MMNELLLATRTAEVSVNLLRERSHNLDSSPFQEVLRLAVRRPAVSRSADTQLVHDVTEGLIIIRPLQAGHRLDDASRARVVDGVVLPLLNSAEGRP